MFYAIVAVICLILDQLSKYWTAAHIEEGSGQVKAIPGLFHLTNVHNTGAAFSFLQGARWFFVVLCVVFVAVVIYLMAKNSIRQPVARWAAVVVMAGAVGNCLDRIISGYVVDMIELEFIKFPVFNVADMFITVGVIVFVIAMLLEKPEGAEAGKAPAKGKVVPLPTPAAETPAARQPEAAPVRAKVQSKETKAEPPKAAPAKPAPKPAEREDPLDAWEALKAAKAQPVKKEAPAKPAPAAPKAAEAPAAGQEEEETYDLDSILAEFKDI